MAAFSELCCLLMVCLIAAVNGTSLPMTEPPPPPPTTTPNTPATPTPPTPCIGLDGTWHTPGESYSYDVCRFCECTHNGPECYTPTCLPCSNPVHVAGECCPICEEPTTTPSSPPPTTTPPTTTTPSLPTTPPFFDCFASDGSRYTLGQSYNYNPCTFCECRQHGPMCLSVTCPPCNNPVHVDGQCCPNCEESTTTPSPPPLLTTLPTTTTPSYAVDCIAPDGSMYYLGQSYSYDSCTFCECTYNGPECYSTTSACPPCNIPVHVTGQCCPICEESTTTLPTTTTLPYIVECFASDATHYGEGEIYNYDLCTLCKCTHTGPECYPVTCPLCDNPVHVDGQCCPVCGGTTPFFVNCIGSDGSNYTPGQSYNYDPCTFCECEHEGAQCYSVTCPPCDNPVHVAGQCCPNCEGSTTTPVTTPFFVDCFASDGSNYTPGQSYNYDPCTFCECTPNGAECYSVTCPPCNNPVHVDGQCCPNCEETTTPPTTTPPTTTLHLCAFVTCLSAPCSDAVTRPGDCCPTCPNGPDCRDFDTGELSSPGSYYVSVTGADCVCPESDGPFPMGYREPMCRPLTTTVPPGCLYDGRMYAPGENFQPQACMWCYCDEMSMQAFCAQPSCMVPLCPRPVSGEGICCPTCPNGPACLGMEGEEILNGQTKTYPDGTECTCQLPEDYYGGGFELTAICTAPKPKSCEWQGTEYPEGRFQPDPCTHCECVEGNAQCYVQDCARPPCENPQPVPGQCCPVCSNGPDCMGRDGGMIAAGSSVTYEDGEVCHCPEAPGEMSFEPKMPVCTMPTTTPPTPTRRPRRPTKRPRRQRLQRLQRRLRRLQSKKTKKTNTQKRVRRDVSMLLSKLLAK